MKKRDYVRKKVLKKQVYIFQPGEVRPESVKTEKQEKKYQQKFQKKWPRLVESDGGAGFENTAINGKTGGEAGVKPDVHKTECDRERSGQIKIKNENKTIK